MKSNLKVDRSFRPKGDDDELSVLGPLLDIVGHDGDVLEVEGGVDLVHDVERRRLVVVEGEDEGERAERLLAAAEVGDALPRFLGRPHAEDDALGEGVERVDQLELGVAAERDHLVHLLELPGDDDEPLHELVEPHLAQLVVRLAVRVTLARDVLQLGNAT